MGILLTLAVVNFNSSQVNARDSERKGDVESIMYHLETYYNNDSSDALGNFAGSGGKYPGTNYISTPGTFASILPDIDPKSTHAPGVDLSGSISLVSATNNVQTISGVLPKPALSNDVYVYQPINAAGSLCVDTGTSGDCRKFNIYFYEESTNTIKQLTSKNQ
jgi:hypothetical protein